MQLKNLNLQDQTDKKTQIITTQEKLTQVTAENFENTREQTLVNIHGRHSQVAEEMRNSIQNIINNREESVSRRFDYSYQPFF